MIQCISALPVTRRPQFIAHGHVAMPTRKDGFGGLGGHFGYLWDGLHGQSHERFRLSLHDFRDGLLFILPYMTTIWPKSPSLLTQFILVFT
jgi:hypothetical protein